MHEYESCYHILYTLTGMAVFAVYLTDYSGCVVAPQSVVVTPCEGGWNPANLDLTHSVCAEGPEAVVEDDQELPHTGAVGLGYNSIVFPALASLPSRLNGLRCHYNISYVVGACNEFTTTAFRKPNYALSSAHPQCTS